MKMNENENFEDAPSLEDLNDWFEDPKQENPKTGVPSLKNLYEWFGNPDNGTLETITGTPTDKVENNFKAIKIFVDSQGNIEKKYSLFQKVKLGFLWKMNKNKYFSEKKKIDDKIITKYAIRKIDEAYSLFKEGIAQLKQLELEQTRYFDKIESVKKKFSDHLDYAEKSNNSYKELKKINDKSKKRIEANEDLNLIITKITACNEAIPKFRENFKLETKRAYVTKLRFEYLNSAHNERKKEIDETKKKITEIRDAYNVYSTLFSLWEKRK
jgi:hypothetical protein